jgi:hypothetical protein
MTITVDVNSYISATDADAYFGERLYADDWTSASDAVREKALIMARRVIDQQQFTGERTSADQLLAWPRTGIASVDSSTVPQDVVDAQCELALAFIRNDLTLNDDSRGVRSSREQIGPLVKETVYDGRAPVRILPDVVMAILRPYFAAAESANSVALVF